MDNLVKMLTEEEMEHFMQSFGNGTFSLEDVNVTMLLEAAGEGEKPTGRSPHSPMLPYRLELDVGVQIGLYCVIFLLAILGNLAVILTLVQNQGMRTITNLFLLNLAIADLLVGVFCMPFTLVGIVLKDFVFGAALCKLIPYLQAVSVSVSAWTLVAISVERYYAICHPLTSRRWQTLSHAYKIIAIVWLLSLLCMSPIAFVNMLQPIRKTGRNKCREEWPDETLEKTYTLFLDMILLVLPLFIMAVKYGLITKTLWPSATHNDPSTAEQSSMLATNPGDDLTTTASPVDPRITDNSTETPASSCTPSSQLCNSLKRSNSPSSSSIKRLRLSSFRRSSGSVKSSSNNRPSSARTGSEDASPPTLSGSCQHRPSLRINMNHRGSVYSGNQVQVNGQNGRPLGVLRRSNAGKSLTRKKRVIQMLRVVVLEFFVCWTPLYVMNTWYLFSPTGLYETIGPLGVSLVHLICYFSSCVNPLTYCFMNKSFRTAFCHVFGCHCSRDRMTSTSHRNDSVRFTRNRSLYTANMKARDDV